MPNYNGKKDSILTKLGVRPRMPPSNTPEYRRLYMKIYRYHDKNKPSKAELRNYLKKIGVLP